MQLFSIETGRFKLDGGAMFGVVPKVIWEKTNPADSRNLIDMAMRCLLVQEGDRLILIDNGLGHKYDDKFKGLYDIDNHQHLHGSLAAHGFHANDITDVVLTHLHFDHCGGSTHIDDSSGQPVVSFPNAQYWLQQSHYDLYLHPNAREKASFFAENVEPIVSNGQLKLIDGPLAISPNVRVQVVNGHTSGQQLPIIQYGKYTILFAADLFPSYGHIPLPYVMGYDTQPLITLDEREHYLKWLATEQIVLFYEHDPYNECGTIRVDGRGKYHSDQTFPLSSILN